MPLLSGSDHHIIAENVRELRRAGHPEDQALAIALHKSRDGADPSYTDPAQAPAPATPPATPATGNGTPGTDPKPLDLGPSLDDLKSKFAAPDAPAPPTGGLAAAASAAAKDRAKRGVTLEKMGGGPEDDPGVASAHHQMKGQSYDDKGRKVYYDEKSKKYYHTQK